MPDLKYQRILLKISGEALASTPPKMFPPPITMPIWTPSR